MDESSNEIGGIRHKSIIIIFIWREIKKGRKITKYYFHNIIDLLSGKGIINDLQNHNLSLYFGLHHKST